MEQKERVARKRLLMYAIRKMYIFYILKYKVYRETS